MHQICAHVCAWKSPELLRVFIPRFLESITEDVNLKIVLNEADAESINICRDYKIDFVSVDKNYGTLAVDFLIPFTKAEYVLQSNTDMIYPRGWDKIMISRIRANGDCSVSASLCEPHGTGNPVVIVDNLGEFTDINACHKFRQNFRDGRYKLPNQTNYMHPILTKFSDLIKIGGYSDNMDMEWHPGYSLDNSFAYRLWELYNHNFRFITLGDLFVYHGISQTNNKLSPEIKGRNGINYFIKKYGKHWQDFNREIGLGTKLTINE